MPDIVSDQRLQCAVCSAMVPALLTPLHSAWHEDDADKPVVTPLTTLRNETGTTAAHVPPRPGVDR
ncbi:hypothetical protein [Nocardioides sp. LS1]|uniref:hypothetical protein n=1 Tax=Nocardioides sp. LS1 TaxID=1027620 RepID=UPI000F6181C6|nr:hypothetical protein [Nocardioides sp. LS1]